MKLIANSQRSLDDLVHKLISTWNEKHYVRVTLTTGRDRTLDQNALWFAMYERISQTLGDGSAEDIAHWRAYCKLRCGVPILQVHNDSFRNQWHRLVLSNPALHGWHQQMELMRDPMFGQDGFPVTRLMDTKQGAEYTDSIDRHFSEQGVFFEDLLDGRDKPKRLAAKAKTKRH